MEKLSNSFLRKWPNLLSGGFKIARHYVNGKLKFVVMNLK